MQFIEKVNKFFEIWNEDVDGYNGVLYRRLFPFSNISQSYSLSWKNDGTLQWHLYEDKPDFHRTHETIDFDTSRTVTKFKKCPDVTVIPITEYEFYLFSDGVSIPPFFMKLMCDGKHDHDPMIDIITEDMDKLMENISHCFIKKDKKDNISEFGIATISDGQLYTSWYDLPKKFDIDIKKQYNDDLPYDKICSIIEDESRADLMLFYGEPGTGKSTLIKHLISMYTDRQFIFLDANILAGIQPAKFITYLTENENSILILEDCEKVLQSREMVENGIMSTILNITDGVISDILGIKLICTFNTALSKIDEALLRKGRLSLKYEFKKLAKDKAIALGGNGEQSLADIFNKEENDYSKKVTRKIGF